MPSPKNRSRSVKRKKKKGKTTHYKRSKGMKVSCGICKTIVRKHSSNKPIRIARKFGANLCNRCSKLVVSYAERVKKGTTKLESLNLTYQRYVSAIVK